MASLVTQMVKNLPTMQEMWVQSLGQEDSLEEEMEPISVFLPGRFHGQRILEGCRLQGHKKSDTTEQLCTHSATSSRQMSTGHSLQLFIKIKLKIIF